MGLSDRLPFWHVEADGLMVFKDGSLGCGWCLQGLDIGCVDHGRINEVSQKIEHLVSSIPEGTSLQIFYKVSPREEKLLKEHREISRDAGTLYEPVRNSRCAFLEDIQSSRGFFNPEIICFFRGTPRKFSRRRLWESSKHFERMTRKEFREHREDFLKSARHIRSSLENAELVPEELSSTGWFELLFQFLNLERSEKLKTPKLRDKGISPQVVLTDLIVHKDALEFGKYLFRTITLKELPEGETTAATVEGFLQLPFHFFISQNIRVENQKRETDRLQLSRRLAVSAVKGAENVRDLESESKLKHTEELLGELIEGSEKIVSMDFNVTFWGESREELEEKSDEVLQAFHRMGGSEGLVETLPLFDVFLSSIPGACEVFREKKVKSSNCAHLMPVYSHRPGNARPVCLFEHRDGGLVKFDPFTEELPSWNALVFASSGSGKSFAVLQVALQFYGQSPTPRVVWIDNGASCKRMLDSSILDGQFIDLNLESGICLNMFDLPSGESRPGPSKSKLILAILEQILREDGDRGLPKRHKAILEEAIYRAYERANGEMPTLGTLRDILERHESEEMKSYARILFSWTGDRAYGRMLDGRTNIDLTKNLTAVEIKGLDAYPDLQNVMLLNFTEFIKSRVSEDSSRKTLLIIDEAWKMLETPSGREFTVEAYRTFRKYGSGIWCISQNYKDFLRDENTANAIFPNTSSIFILKQTKIDWEDFEKRLQLNEAEVDIVRGLSSVKGEYSEVFLMQNDYRAILKICADPLSYWIGTSDPNDKRRIAGVEAKMPEATKLEILEEIIKEDYET